MWMNQLFTQAPVNFEKRCKMRIVVAVILACLGAGAIGMAVYSGG